jgi:hypothetical protein
MMKRKKKASEMLFSLSGRFRNIIRINVSKEAIIGEW